MGDSRSAAWSDSKRCRGCIGLERGAVMSDIVSANAALPVAINAQEELIRSRILTIRGVQVMLDRDLAELYGVPTKRLNEQVKRNIGRFPSNFMFRLSAQELADWRSQIATSNLGNRADKPLSVPQNATTDFEQYVNMGVRYRPFAFTEHGIIMLASVLKSATAVAVSIQITNAFVAMRKALASIAPVMARIAETERLQLEEKTARLADQKRNEERFDVIFKAMDGNDFPPQKVFFEGKHYEAYSFARKLVRRATKSIVLVDNYCDDITLDILANKRGGVDVTIATSAKSAKKAITPTTVAKFNKENPTLAIRETGVFHDRFLIIDDKELYLFGASLKDLGRQYCAVTKMDAGFILSIKKRI